MMKRVLSVYSLVFVLTVPANLLAADFETGFEAARKGDYATALREWWPLAERGYEYAQYNLGLMYEEGFGVVKDHKESVKWYRKAALQGVAHAQFDLGHKYAEGRGVTRDYKKAVKWYHKAAVNGIDRAQNNLGLMYDEGKGVIRNSKIAKGWYRKAAMQWNVNAQLNLGMLYESEESLVRALMWFSIAARSGNRDAMGYRIEAENKMTSLSVFTAYMLAQDWMRQHPQH
jgi:hypothetical protein